MPHATILAVIAASSNLRAEFSVIKSLDNEHGTLLEVVGSCRKLHNDDQQAQYERSDIYRLLLRITSIID
jgi:hypothetical protein